LGNWDLFEPALVRHVWCISLPVSGLEVGAMNTSGVNSVWARDLVFGAWNFHHSHESSYIQRRQSIAGIFGRAMNPTVMGLQFYCQWAIVPSE